MFLKIVKNDSLRKKAITTTVFIFIMLAVLLWASATNIIANLVSSIKNLQQAAMPADITQMHLGDIDQKKIEQFAQINKDNIAMQETMMMLNIEGKDIYFGDNKSFAGTIQDISFVVQNQKFDFILDLDNQKLQIEPGYIAVPIYYMQTYGLEIGDVLKVIFNDYEKQFIIADYARDAEMNTSFAGSKRFVINQLDFKELYQTQIAEVEYLIEFKLAEEGDLNSVQAAYIDAGLPANGPNVTGKMFLIFTAMSDATVAIIIILISVFIVIIAILCIRLTFQSSIEEDLKEIGVLKAIGLSRKSIKVIYLNKYRVISAMAGLVGYFLSFLVTNIFNGNMKLYISSQLSGNLKYFLSLLAPIFVYLIIIVYCRKMLKKIDRISAIEALCSDINERGKSKKNSFALLKNKFFSTNTYMGLRDVWKRFYLYRFMIVIFAVCMFIMILPISMYNTFNSSDACTYLGIGKADVRIDLRRTETITQEYLKLQKELQNDQDIEKYSPVITCAYQVKNLENTWEYINIETGDFSIFPLQYLDGVAPSKEGEIALSHLLASNDGLSKQVGDDLKIRIDGQEKKLKVCGIYQDVTNGGRTAKAHPSIGLNKSSILWYIIYINLYDNTKLTQKIDYYKNAYMDAQVNSVTEYTQQTLGNIIDEMKKMIVGGFVIGIGLAILITVLYLKMLLSKDISQIAIMCSIGLTSKNIKHHYVTSIFTVLILGNIFGGFFSNFLGEMLLGFAMSSMGASKVQLVNVVWQTWLLCPLGLFLIIGITISVCFNVMVEKDLSVVLRS